MEQLEAIKNASLNTILKSFEYDEILDAIAKGQKAPLRGQLLAIKSIHERADRLMRLWQKVLGIEQPEQTIKQYVITREGQSIQPSQGADTSNPGSAPIQST